MSHARLAAFVLCAAALWVHPVYAETYALIVGVNESTAGDEPLAYADDDAIAYAQLFEPVASTSRVLVAPDPETVRTNSSLPRDLRPPTRREVLRSVQELARRARQSDSPSNLVVIYVGHGNVDEDGAGFLNLLEGRLTRDDLYREILERPEFDQIHLVIDACQSFFMVAGRGGDRKAPLADGANQEAFNRMLLRGSLRAYPHVGLLLSTSGDQQSFEWSRVRGGVFSHVLRSGLRGGADIDGDGRMTYGEVHAFVMSALQGIEDARLRPSVLIQAPRQAPLAPLIDLESARFARYLEVDRPGRLTLEDRRTVLADTHRSAPYVLALNGDGPYYARIGTEDFVVDLHGRRSARLKPTVRDRPAARGKADDALRTGLFAFSYDASYYRAFSALAEYPVVQASEHRRAWDPIFEPAWTVQLAPRVGTGLLEGGGAAVGLNVQGAMPLSRHLFITAGVGFDQHQTEGLTFDPTVRMLSVPVGAEAVLPLVEGVELLGYGQIGYAYLSVRGESRNQPYNADEPAGFFGRIGTGARVRFQPFTVGAGVSLREVAARVGAKRRFFGGVEGSLLLSAELP